MSTPPVRARPLVSSRSKASPECLGIEARKSVRIAAHENGAAMDFTGISLLPIRLRTAAMSPYCS
jgi:hypothetical protein